MFGLAINAYADRQLDLASSRLLEQGEQTVASGIAARCTALRHNCDIHDILFLVFIGVVRCSLDNNQSLISHQICYTFIESDFRWDQEYFRKEILFLEAFVVIDERVLLFLLGRHLAVECLLWPGLEVH